MESGIPLKGTDEQASFRLPRLISRHDFGGLLRNKMGSKRSQGGQEEVEETKSADTAALSAEPPCSSQLVWPLKKPLC